MLYKGATPRVLKKSDKEPAPSGFSEARHNAPLGHARNAR
jgi:hypothetical protein